MTSSSAARFQGATVAAKSANWMSRSGAAPSRLTNTNPCQTALRIGARCQSDRDRETFRLLHMRRADEAAVEAETPAVIRAGDDAARFRAIGMLALQQHIRGAVRADAREGADGAVMIGVHEQDRLVQKIDRQDIAPGVCSDETCAAQSQPARSRRSASCSKCAALVYAAAGSVCASCKGKAAVRAISALIWLTG